MRAIKRKPPASPKCVDSTLAHAPEYIASVHAVTQVRNGYSIRALKQLAALLGVSQTQVTAALGISPSDVARRARDGRAMSLVASDRLYRAFKAIEFTTATLGDAESATRWFRRDHPALGGVTPLSLMDTTAGYERVQDELVRIAHGVPA